MTLVTQDIKISCHNSVIKGTMAKSNDGHPWRNWKITLVAMEGEKEMKGKLSIILDHVCYILHPTFEDPRRVKTEEPYSLEEKGWGEFDMRIVLYFADSSTDPKVLTFDLNFAQSNYSKIHKVEFPDASPELIQLLARDPSVANTNKPRKGGKKPVSSSTVHTSSSNNSSSNTNKTKSKSNVDYNNNENSSSSSSSSSVSNSRQTAKKKPASDSPHKSVKKAKPDTTKPESKVKVKKLSNSPPPPRPKSPSSTELSPASISSPIHAHKSTTSRDSTPSIEEKYIDTKPPPINNTYNAFNDPNVAQVCNMSDVYNLEPIYRAKLDQETREKWDIPDINMMELAKRMCRMTPEQSQEFQAIIAENYTEDMKIVYDEDGPGGSIDLYTLGTSLLEKLWEYSADMASDDNQSYTSQDPHASDLELDSDMELGEYNSDMEMNGEIEDSNTEREDGEESDYNRYGSGAYEPTGYREIGEFHYTPDHNNVIQNSGADEPGFNFSDSDTNENSSNNRHSYGHTNGFVNHHTTNGGYHENSDMDVQDDSDY